MTQKEKHLATALAGIQLITLAFMEKDYKTAALVGRCVIKSITDDPYYSDYRDKGVPEQGALKSQWADDAAKMIVDRIRAAQASQYTFYNTIYNRK